MENLLAFGVLISIPTFLGFRYTTEFRAPFSGNNWKFHNLLAALIFMGYLILFFVLGKAGLYELNDYNSELRKFSTYFVLPSIGFGLTLFPKVAAEYFENYTKLAQVNIVSFVAFPGWLIIIYLALVILVP